jgi:hypothetical protein
VKYSKCSANFFEKDFGLAISKKEGMLGKEIFTRRFRCHVLKKIYKI